MGEKLTPKLADKMVIAIGAAPVPGVPPGRHDATCQVCGGEHKVQTSTARVIARYGDGCLVLCVTCLAAVAKEVAEETGTRVDIEIRGMSAAPDTAP